MSNRHYLKKHIQIVHEGQKNHTCETCGKEFAQKCDLKKHFKTIHEGEKVKCEICGKQFTQLTYLRTHIKFVHEGQERTKKCWYCFGPTRGRGGGGTLFHTGIFALNSFQIDSKIEF